MSNKSVELRWHIDPNTNVAISVTLAKQTGLRTSCPICGEPVGRQARPWILTIYRGKEYIDLHPSCVKDLAAEIDLQQVAMCLESS